MKKLKYFKEQDEHLKIGDTVNGHVKSIKPYGAFIEYENGKMGLLHIEDISIARIKNPSERVSVGQDIQVKVIRFEDENKVCFSSKEIFGTWEDNAKLFREGEIVKGTIRETEKNKNGIFIELKPNLVGMAEYKDGFKYGEKVDVYIKKIQNDKKKIKLIIK